MERKTGLECRRKGRHRDRQSRVPARYLYLFMKLTNFTLLRFLSFFSSIIAWLLESFSMIQTTSQGM